MTKIPLEPFKNAKADLFFWVKQYLASKMFSLQIDDEYAISFNPAANSERILASGNDQELNETVKEIRKNGMKNYGVYYSGALAFYRFVEADKKIESIKEIDTSYRDRYFTKNSTGLSPGTLKNYFVQVNSIFKFIEEQNEDGFKFSLGKTRSGRRTAVPIVDEERNPSYLTPDEFKQFLDALETYPYLRENPSQTRLMMKIACFGGLRVDELVSLKTEQFSFVQNPSPLLQNDTYLRINVNGKAKKKRTVFIQMSLIQNDYDDHMKHRTCGNDLIFCNHYGERYDNRSPNEQLVRILKSIGINKSGMHTLRRSYATFLMAREVDYATISELLGHESEDMTDLYVQITKDGLRKIVKYWENI
ncbi:MAG: tyrosine-type recombinase/integrase [Sulfurimonas sp.]